MDAELTEAKLASILSSTSVKSNFQKGVAMAHYHGNKGFSSLSGADSHMQQMHVSGETMGVPGLWLRSQEPFISEVKKGTQPAFQALKEMCEDMGYKL